MTDLNRDTPSPVNRDISYERKDLNVGWLGISAAILLLLTVVAMLVALWGLGALETRQAAVEPTPLPLLDLRPTPPAPRLQPNPIDRATAEEDLATLRAREEAILRGYGWVDREAGLVRIPIEQAMDLLAEESPLRDDEPAK